MGRIGALHCHNLSGCDIVVGVCGSSALLYNCRECSLTIAAKQLRLHDSEKIALHIHTLSGPVVENCQKILVSPYDLSYPCVDNHWQAAFLGVPRPMLESSALA